MFTSTPFQYSFCSYSTEKNFVYPTLKMSFNTASVLIQPILQSLCQPIKSSFNTASVLIQRRKKMYEQISLLFQYSFCSYSTSLSSAEVASSKSFNTASVLIQLEWDIRIWDEDEFQYSFCSYSTQLYGGGIYFL